MKKPSKPKLYYTLKMIYANVRQAYIIRRNLRKSNNSPKEGVLVYVGMNRGFGFDNLFPFYERSFGFEADPRLYKYLKEKYKRFRNVEIIHGAVTDFDGVIKLNVANNDGASSSLGQFKNDWLDGQSVEHVKTIEVPAINLCNFFPGKNVNYIDDYVSDIQGMDLQVLKSVKKYIDEQRIGTITCEVTKDQHQNIYKDLPDNSETGFRKLLENNYSLRATGWKTLKEGVFEKVPESWWEMDCMWKLKSAVSAS